MALPTRSQTSPQVDSFPTGNQHEWTAYANGGVRKDDEGKYQKAVKDEARFQAEKVNVQQEGVTEGGPATERLVDISPRRNPNAASRNTALLVDLDVGLAPPPSPMTSLAIRSRYKENFSYADAAGGGPSTTGGDVLPVTSGRNKTRRSSKAAGKEPVYDLLD